MADKHCEPDCWIGASHLRDHPASQIRESTTMRILLLLCRQRVRVSAEMLRRTGGGRIAGIWINGQYLDLVKIVDDFKNAVGKIIARRSLDWVNNIAARFNVKFALDG